MSFSKTILLTLLLCITVVYFSARIGDNHAAHIFLNTERFTNSNSETVSRKRWTIKDFYTDNDRLTNVTDSIFNALSTDEQAAQMIMPATGEYKGFGLPFPDIVALLKAKQIGGVLLLKGTTPVFTKEIKTLTQLADSNHLLPPVFSCDCEPALFHRKFTDIDSTTATADLKTTEQVQNSASFISSEMMKMGIQWNYFPVVDVDSNKAIIGNRSFGSNPEEIYSKSLMFMETFADSNIASTLKHFPGHGAVAGDSHKGLVYIDSALTELNNFTRLINTNETPSVLVGHIAVKRGEYKTGGQPSSLSYTIVTKLLKDSLHFKGLAVTDAMNMGAVKNIPDADFKAVKAGIDIVVMPQDVERLHAKLVVALKQHDAFSNQLISSIRKIIRFKICLGIVKP